ncbi:hypothetical protein [Lentzea sp. NPDC060358]|uniref:hypothetical protein n=1 Tax=Lentzea sp. NPDC060358 TaxID=3347103 RepID=UPI0036685389
MSGVGNALLLAGASLLLGSVVFLLAAGLGRAEPSTPRTARRLAVKVRVTWVVLAVSVVAVCAGSWLGD